MPTECTCNPQEFPFHCPRHGCWKTAHWRHLCQTDADYFQAWEEGRGPALRTTQSNQTNAETESGQQTHDQSNPLDPSNTDQPNETNAEPEASSTGENDQEPGLARKAVNFTKAAVRHIADGARKVDEATYQQRLDICRDCPSCNVRRMICQEKRCGCRLRLKARWRSEACPLSKWPETETEPEEDEP